MPEILEKNCFKVETENNTFVYLCDGQGRIEGFDSSELNTDSDSVLNAFNNIYPRLTSEGISNIMKCFDDFKNYGIIIQVARKIIEFCFYCDNFEKNENGHNLNVFLNVVKDTSSNKVLLHDMFAIRIASKYVNDHKVKVNIKKNENGFADLKIGDFKCECKIRMGPLDNPEKLKEIIEKQIEERRLPKEKVKEEMIEYDDLTKDRTKENVPKDVAKTFSKKKADVVFIDYKRIEYKNENGIIKSGIGNYNLDNVFTKSNEKTELPTLRKNMIIYNLHYMGEDLWYPASFKE